MYLYINCHFAEFDYSGLKINLHCYRILWMVVHLKGFVMVVELYALCVLVSVWFLMDLFSIIFTMILLSILYCLSSLLNESFSTLIYLLIIFLFIIDQYFRSYFAILLNLIFFNPLFRSHPYLHNFS